MPYRGDAIGNLDARYVNVTGDTMTDNLILNDNDKIIFGAGQDGEIYSDGNNLVVRALTSNQDMIFYVNDGGVDTEMMRFNADAARTEVQASSSAKSLRLFYDASNYASIHINSSGEVIFTPTGSNIQLTGAEDDFPTMKFVSRSDAQSWHGAYFLAQRSRDSGIVQNGDTLFTIDAFGHGGVGFERAASIVMAVDGTPGDDDMPGKIMFKTSADGDNTAPTRVTIDNAGVMLVDNKIAFTQTDYNEYIDSLNDGYMDYGATTAHRFDNTIVQQAITQQVSGSKTLTDGSATGFFEVTVGASEMIGGTVHYTIYATDGTDFQTHTGSLTFAAVNKAGTVSSDIDEVYLTASETEVVTSGTLTDAFTITDGVGKITVNCNANSSLDDSVEIYYTIIMHSLNTITKL